MLASPSATSVYSTPICPPPEAGGVAAAQGTRVPPGGVLVISPLQASELREVKAKRDQDSSRESSPSKPNNPPPILPKPKSKSPGRPAVSSSPPATPSGGRGSVGIPSNAVRVLPMGGVSSPGVIPTPGTGVEGRRGGGGEGGEEEGSGRVTALVNEFRTPATSLISRGGDQETPISFDEVRKWRGGGEGIHVCCLHALDIYIVGGVVSIFIEVGQFTMAPM